MPASGAAVCFLAPWFLHGKRPTQTFLAAFTSPIFALENTTWGFAAQLDWQKRELPAAFFLEPWPKQT